jgi:hypothetical protein
MPVTDREGGQVVEIRSPEPIEERAHAASGRRSPWRSTAVQFPLPVTRARRFCCSGGERNTSRSAFAWLRLFSASSAPCFNSAPSALAKRSTGVTSGVLPLAQAEVVENHRPQIVGVEMQEVHLVAVHLRRPESHHRISDVVKREQSRLRNFIRRRVPDRRDAEDILQDVFYEPDPLRRIWRPWFLPLQLPPSHGRAVGAHDSGGAGTISARHARTLRLRPIHQREHEVTVVTGASSGIGAQTAR